MRIKFLWAVLLASMLGGCSPLLAYENKSNVRITQDYKTLALNSSKQGVFKYLGQFKATAYCSCSKCCGKSDGITASGRKASAGTIACNWLPFGTKLQYREIASNAKIEASRNDSIGTVLDRGAKSLFGSKHNHIKHIDLWMDSHRQALIWGVRMVDVWAIVAPPKDLGT